MKARIEKKLSKKISEMMPNYYGDAWQDSHDEPSELACDQSSCVSGVMRIGGGVDFWGEGQDDYSVWDDFKVNWPYCFDFKYDENTYYPDTTGFKDTTINKFKLIRGKGAL